MLSVSRGASGVSWVSDMIQLMIATGAGSRGGMLHRRIRRAGPMRVHPRCLGPPCQSWVSLSACCALLGLGLRWVVWMAFEAPKNRPSASQWWQMEWTSDGPCSR